MATIGEQRARLSTLEDDLAAREVPQNANSEGERIARHLTEAVVVHCRGDIVYANAATAKLFGADASELIGRPILSFVAPEDRATVIERSRCWAEASSAEPLRHKSMRADGTVYEVETTGTPIDWQGERAVLIITRDLTERSRAAAALAESEERYRRLVDLLPDAVYIHDGNSILFVNPSGVDMFGAASAEEIIGRSPLEFSHSSDQRNVVARASEVLRHKVSKESQRRRRLRMDGSEYLADVSAVHINWHGTPAVLAVVRDVTAQVRASEDLRRSNAELEQFAYVASHDLQEPLRTVASYCQLIERRYKTRFDEQGLEYLGFAVDGAKRMQRLITDLLAFSRVGTKGKPFAPTDLNKVCEDAISNLDRAIANSVAQVTAGPLPTIDGDAVQLTQLFQNLIGNAIKFRGAAAPVVHIGTAGEGDGRVFSVADNGIGIDPQHRERIFQIFQRLHERDKYDGTGIGLAVCKKIVERHGGRIWVEDAPGGGCAFRFTLPGEPA
jgi:PAS domain S-box-containing protein